MSTCYNLVDFKQTKFRISSRFVGNFSNDEETFQPQDFLPLFEYLSSDEFECSCEYEDTDGSNSDEQTYIESPTHPNSGAPFDGSNSILHSIDNNTINKRTENSFISRKSKRLKFSYSHLPKVLVQTQISIIFLPIYLHII